ncbi:MAG: RES family NAD+ phosphorylase [Anaerolineales bacterium]
MRLRRKVWRHVPAGAHPLHAGYILRANGRWNRRGVYGCLYTAFTRRGARTEYMKYLRGEASSVFGVKPRELVSIQVNLEPVADLTNSETSPIAHDEPFLLGDEPTDLEACRALADSLRREGFVGIIALSAAMSSEKNLMIYIDGLAENVRLEVGADRIPLSNAI